MHKNKAANTGWLPIKNHHADSMIFKKYIASISVKRSRQSRQIMVLIFQDYLNLKNLLRLLFIIHIHIRHAKKELMNVIMVLYEDLFQKVSVSVTLM